ncbi:MAG: hypothetical protein HWD59_06915 [Coxiellaceae bacterium]|nr:MAG: hypothetical protein HWD59_06915 [Coxiellaceae bacterium]
MFKQEQKISKELSRIAEVVKQKAYRNEPSKEITRWFTRELQLLREKFQ